jgi:hypothetical protein
VSLFTNNDNKKIANQNPRYGQGQKSPAPTAPTTVKHPKKEDKSQHYRGIIFLQKERKIGE